MDFISIQPRGFNNSIDEQYFLHEIQADYYIVKGYNTIHRTRRLCTSAKGLLVRLPQTPGKEMTFFVKPVQDPMHLTGYKLCKQCTAVHRHYAIIETESIARSIEISDDMVDVFDRSQSINFYVNQFYRVISAFFQQRNGKFWGDDLMVQDVATGKYRTIFWQEVRSVEGFDKGNVIYSKKLK